MSPGGHLLTTAVACAASLALTESVPVTAAIAAGGFLIDVDHFVDYVLFEKQRDLRPGAFLRYYLDGRVQRAVLVLHSYELFVLLGMLAWWTDAEIVWGYLGGALLHLALDLSVNGEYTPRSISAFYSFAYRWHHRFDMQALLARDSDLVVPDGFWAAFFRGAVRPRTTIPGAVPAVIPAPGRAWDRNR
jgi:hypothetical protein